MYYHVLHPFTYKKRHKRILLTLVCIALVCYLASSPSYPFYLSSVNLPFELHMVPAALYSNADEDKDLVVKHNKGKLGIYRWIHIKSGKSYIGSSVNLSIRLSQYYNYNHISDPKNKMIIYKALLRYGYATFRLEILEYCSEEELIEI